MCFVRSIIKTNSSFEMPEVSSGSSLRRDLLPGYKEPDSAIGYHRGGGGASQLQPSSSIEKQRKTVRMSESHQYYSDYNYDTDEWWRHRDVTVTSLF